MATREPGDLTTRVLVEIRDELRTGLGGLREEFAGLKGEFAGLKGEFAELRGEFKDLRGEFHEMKVDLADVKAELRGVGVTVKQVLRAVEYGTTRRDAFVADHETRIRRLEEHVGLRP